MTVFVNPEQFREARRLEVDDEYITEEEIWSIDDNLLEEVPDLKWIQKERNIQNGEKSLEIYPEETERFCEEISKDFKLLWLEKRDPTNSSTQLQISDKTIKYILENDLLEPRFNLAFGQTREKFLNKMGISKKLSQKSFILIFRLPKLLMEGLTPSELDQDIRISTEEGSYLYKSLRRILWEKIGKYQEEEGIFFRRLNPKKQHRPTEYYYIWEIKKNKLYR